VTAMSGVVPPCRSPTKRLEGRYHRIMTGAGRAVAIVIAYMKNSTIERVFSTDHGASFRPAARADTEGQTFDPTLAANLLNGTFYLNYLGAIQGQSAGHWSTTSPDGDVFSNHTTLQKWNAFFDRPWLVAAEQHVWMSYVDRGSASGLAFFRAGAVSGSTVTRPVNGVVWVPDVLPPLEHNPQAIIARGKCNCGLTPVSSRQLGQDLQVAERRTA
jgi:hypothetical protein